MLKKIIYLFVLIVFLFLITSCPDEFFAWEFKNKSSYTVSVSDLKDANDTSFNISPGKSKSVIIKTFTEIQFDYSPSNLVDGDIDTANKIIKFTNK
ncbi:MAG: hypothetical protein JXB50_16685 [Spirochaetes bacterium]|nr:hypothetical protein [Spirochaetota bacterium]